MSALQTTSGSSILPPTNGHGWVTAATSRSYHRLYTERRERLLTETALVGAMGLQVGPTEAAISGSSEARRLSPLPCMTTIFGSIRPRRQRRYQGSLWWT